MMTMIIASKYPVDAKFKRNAVKQLSNRTNNIIEK